MCVKEEKRKRERVRSCVSLSERESDSLSLSLSLHSESDTESECVKERRVSAAPQERGARAAPRSDPVDSEWPASGRAWDGPTSGQRGLA